MSARDKLHDAVKNALVKDGWTITHDPFPLQFGGKDLYADLGAERTLAAERGNEKIVVDVKSFLSASEVHDLEVALGQFTLYRILLAKSFPDRLMFLALPEVKYRSLLSDADGQELVAAAGLRFLTINPEAEEIVRWSK